MRVIRFGNKAALNQPLEKRVKTESTTDDEEPLMKLDNSQPFVEFGKKPVDCTPISEYQFGRKPVVASLLQAPRITTPVRTDNIDEYFMGFEDYKTTPKCEAKLCPASDWWKGAQYRPSDPKKCQEMKTDETLIWRILNSKSNVIVSGKAGSGKSNLLLRFKKNADTASFTYALCSPTGISAFAVGGETLHRRLGLGLATDDSVTLFRLIQNNQRKYNKTWKFLTTTDVLIIDEISMVHSSFFTKLDYLFRKARKSEKPFGDIRLVVVGDFTQLGPIGDKEPNNIDIPKYVLDSEVWSRMNFARIILDRSYRQTAGEFLDLLNELRIGKLSDRGRKTLLSRLNADLDLSTTISIKRHGCDENTDSKKKLIHIQPLDIFPYKYQVEKCNNENLKRLVSDEKAELKKFYPALRVQKKEHVTFVDPEELKRGQDLISGQGMKQVEDYFPLFHLSLAENAQVMMRCNKYIDQGIANGSIGIITSIGDNFISVLFVVNGKFMDKPLDVDRVEFFASVGKTAEVVMSQFPICLSWASTTHKVFNQFPISSLEHSIAILFLLCSSVRD